ncbi:HPr family phosphocarrier protein [Azospirillum doebereinerae]|uniref:HPr family phosphocarrier protein n=1 Tax=Azospirillum doebereinerae TaxID=92933 RepID=A0A3S1CI79_9PROT|nr:HPr family phosphocarrier protein [Azospirillum doebereinerae]MCG5243164.1 HPr family phosphocarrier protein [Azospirillum doebereinerae]RUQ73856.1 HPr family phosphocarrier protein [Azospirillum doebereinerae]
MSLSDQNPDGQTPVPGELRSTAAITNQRGLHARASAKFVKLVATFEAEITVRRGESVVSGESIMGLMMLAAGPGTTVELRARGNQAEEAMAALLDLINRKFDEE